MSDHGVGCIEKTSVSLIKNPLCARHLVYFFSDFNNNHTVIGSFGKPKFSIHQGPGCVPDREDTTGEFKRHDPCSWEPGGSGHSSKTQIQKDKVQRKRKVVTFRLAGDAWFYEMAASELKEEEQRGVIRVDMGKTWKRVGKPSYSHNKDQETKDKEWPFAQKWPLCSDSCRKLQWGFSWRLWDPQSPHTLSPTLCGPPREGCGGLHERVENVLSFV